jgi:hypothetical protein
MGSTLYPMVCLVKRYLKKNISKRSRKNRIFVTASEAKQSSTAKRSRLLRPKGLAMT